MAGSDGRSSLISSLALLLLLSLLTGYGVVGGSHHHGQHHRHHHGHLHASKRVYAFQPAKLFVFGDSYADTGNTRKNDSSSWKIPYSITFPGEPSGRFSSGRLLTDLLAKSFGLRSPLPYRLRNVAPQYLQYGMNFAYGGTGVFDTLVSYPNMSAQIGLFEQLIKDKNFSAADVNSSVTLVTLSGNDYSAYLAKGGAFTGLPTFIQEVIVQLNTNLRRLYGLGFRKVAVASLQPLGCLPGWTSANSFQKCNDTINTLVALHNQLLNQAVAALNNETTSSDFVVMDLYSSFTSVLNSTEFATPLKPCCFGVSSAYSCGSVDANGTKQYTLCEDPESALFWDSFHPTQAGWRAVFRSLPATLQQLL